MAPHRATELLRQAIDRGLQAASHPPLPDLVRLAREQGRSWERLAADVYIASGETVSKQTLINWYPELNKPAEALLLEATEALSEA